MKRRRWLGSVRPMDEHRGDASEGGRRTGDEEQLLKPTTKAFETTLESDADEGGGLRPL